MKQIRSKFNPLLSPDSLKPSNPSMKIECLLNPGVFRYDGKIHLLVRVAERPDQRDGEISFPVLNEDSLVVVKSVPSDSPDLDLSDPRVISYAGSDYLTTMSHLRVLSSEDGVTFTETGDYPRLLPSDRYEAYGIEDCRVTQIGDTFHLTYTAVSENGVAVKMKSTKDWQSFEDHGLILPPHNKDCALLDEKINGKYFLLHRPSSPEIGGNYIWIAESEDLVHWGNHKCLAKTRKGKWDSARVGAGCSPIRTDEGWLSIYHGADEHNRYCLGALLLDLNKPSEVIARSNDPLMVPSEDYELNGFFNNVIFTNGHIVNGDCIDMYYGASDQYVCLAQLSINDILATLK